MRVAPAIFFAIVFALIAPGVAAVEFPVCGKGARITCIVDGDTFWLEGVKIRPQGFDTPEMGKPSCPRRAAGAIEARDALQRLLESGTVQVQPTGRSYDRVLARVTVDGVDIGETMIAAGHARRYVPGAAPWC
jgi:micrococcal nuclease